MAIDTAQVRELKENHDLLKLGTNQRVELVEFAADVKNAIPGCWVTPYDSEWSWVYMPDDHFAMGRIGFGNFSDAGDKPPTYAVKCHHITNRKYRRGSIRYDMTMSTSRDTALKKARTYLRRLTPAETLSVTRFGLLLEINAGSGTLKRDYHAAAFKALGAVPGRDETKLLKELRHLVEIGHTFLHPTMDADVQAMFKAHDAYVSGKDRPNMTFVQILPYDGEQRWDLIDIDDPASYTYRYGDLRTYDGDDVKTHVSEDVQGKVAVLSMLETDTYVAGVGYKAFDGVYYVTR